jgi:Uma2 family endonuclease
MTALKKPELVTVEEYLAGEERSDVRHEYLGGVIHAMSGGTNDHAAIAANGILSLGAQLRGTPCRPFGSDAKVRIEYPDHTRFYYPDLQVVCQLNSGTDHYQERPAVVLEVLSESTRRTDMGEKKDAYLTIPSLKVLLLAECDQPRVVVYRRRSGGGFEAEEYSGLGEVISLAEIGCELPLGELYEGIAWG